MKFLIDRTFREPLLGGSVAGRQGDRRGPPSVSTVNEASKRPLVTLKGFLFGEAKTLSFPFVVVSFPFLCSCFVRCLVWCRRFWVRFVSFTSVRLLHCFALSTSQVLEARGPIITTNNVEDHHDDHNDAANSWRLLAQFPPPISPKPNEIQGVVSFPKFRCLLALDAQQANREGARHLSIVQVSAS